MKTSKPEKKQAHLNQHRTARCVVAEVYVAPDAMELLNQISDDLRGNIPLEVLIQTIFNYGLNTANREQDQEGASALSYLMENAPMYDRSAARAGRKIAA